MSFPTFAPIVKVNSMANPTAHPQPPTTDPICGADVEPRYLFAIDGYHHWRCRRCGLVINHPQPSDEVLAQIYSDSYFDVTGRSVNPEGARQAKIKTFQRNYRWVADRLPRGAKVLDIGAGEGFAMEVARQLGFDPYGLELSESAYRQLVEKFGPDRVFHSNIDDFDTDVRFDLITMFDLIEHPRDPARVLAKAARMLRPGGYLLISTPDTGSLSARLMGRLWVHYKPEHLFYFNQRNMRTLLERHFDEIRIRPHRKILTKEYIASYNRIYIRPPIRQLVAMGLAFLPKGTTLTLPSGELFAIARKPK